MKYLIIDKRQRVKVEGVGEIPTGSARLIEELESRNIEYGFVYNDQLELLFENGETQILANGINITEYSNIIFRGHSLDNEMEYQYKRHIIDHIDEHNNKDPENKVLVQNSEAIKNFPYYNKIAIAVFCSKNGIPHFNTYFKTDGNYLSDREMLKEYPLIIKEYRGKNRLEIINGKEKIKKNVFKLNDSEELEQEGLVGQDLKEFFIQEFSDQAEDYRLFLKLGKVIGGWKRKASSGFMTVSKGIYEMYNNPDDEMRLLAEKVSALLEADFIAIDFMYIRSKPHVQEFSFHPGYKAYETKIEGTPVNIAEAIITAFKE